MSHSPKTINKFQTGLVAYRPQQILADDALVELTNAVTFLETIRRRDAWKLLGRLKRDLVSESLGNSVASPWAFNIYSTLVPPITGEPNAQISPGTVVITIGVIVFTDQGDGTLTSPTPGNSGTINYATGDVVLTHTAGVGIATIITFSYFPGLPAMGIFDRNTAVNTVQNLYFDTKYSYRLIATTGFEQYPINNGVWSLQDFNLPSSTNYWQTDSLGNDNQPIFWLTNLNGTAGEPIRFTDYNTNTWYDFTPSIDGGANFLFQAKFLIPFRGRLFAFNTYEGPTLAGSLQKRQRIRCSAETTPFYQAYPGVITTFNVDAWNDTIPGQGYFQDLPTNEEIIGAWSVMNQIIIKTTSKTWVLTQTGISIAPFKVDLLDDNEGSTSGFSAANMGQSIIDVGRRTINDSSPTYVNSIDQKIINFVFSINEANSGFNRIYAIRDFINRWNSYIYPYQPEGDQDVTYPNRRLIYNYENKSWAIFEDSLTCLGYFRESLSITWAEANFTWAEADFPWNQDSNGNLVSGGNQQGFIGLTDAGISEGASLMINNIIPNGTAAAQFFSVNHNLENGMIIELSGIIGDFSALNGTVALVQTVSVDEFYLFSFNPSSEEFNLPVTAVTPGTYIGGGLITVRHNFFITTKAFNLLNEGQSMHVSYVDTLVNVNDSVTVFLAVFPSFNNNSAVNESPQNFGASPLFGNLVSLSNPISYPITKVNNRAIINQRANILTFQFSLPNSVMNSDEYSTPFSLSSMTIWIRKAGRPLMPFGGG